MLLSNKLSLVLLSNKLSLLCCLVTSCLLCCLVTSIFKEVFVFGENGRGQLGTGNNKTTWQPQRMEFGESILALKPVCGKYHTAILTCKSLDHFILSGCSLVSYPLIFLSAAQVMVVCLFGVEMTEANWDQVITLIRTFPQKLPLSKQCILSSLRLQIFYLIGR